MAGGRVASAENEDCAQRSPAEKVGEKLGRDFDWTVRQGLFIRQVLGGGSERWLRKLRQRTGPGKGLRGAFNVFLDFVIDGFWFLLHSLVLLVAPGYDAISGDDPGEGKGDE